MHRVLGLDPIVQDHRGKAIGGVQRPVHEAPEGVRPLVHDAQRRSLTLPGRFPHKTPQHRCSPPFIGPDERAARIVHEGNATAPGPAHDSATRRPSGASALALPSSKPMIAAMCEQFVARAAEPFPLDALWPLAERMERYGIAGFGWGAQRTLALPVDRSPFHLAATGATNRRLVRLTGTVALDGHGIPTDPSPARPARRPGARM